MLAEKTLINVNQKIVSTDDDLKTSSIHIVQNKSRRDRQKNSSYRSWPKKPSHHCPKNCIGFKNPNKYPINWIGFKIQKKWIWILNQTI